MEPIEITRVLLQIRLTLGLKFHPKFLGNRGILIQLRLLSLAYK